MPFTLPPISRRRFLLGSAGGVSALLLGARVGLSAKSADPNRFALLADTHIDGDPETEARGVVMAKHLEMVSEEVLHSGCKHAAVFVGGDCAYLTGESQDYLTLIELLGSMREAGLPVHLALGNHDNRDRMWAALKEKGSSPQAVVERHLTIVESPYANWFVLDSLDETNKTPGVLGQQQLDWLAEQLDHCAGKPALVMVHHNPDWREGTSGLTDTEQLFEVCKTRSHVKALFFGHTHHVSFSQKQGVHLVNLPPVAYVFNKDDPSGWVDATVRKDGIDLRLRSLDQDHPLHDKITKLNW
jgi:3',5'-cyclic AMP phosphodiesterase CpdA